MEIRSRRCWRVPRWPIDSASSAGQLDRSIGISATAAAEVWTLRNEITTSPRVPAEEEEGDVNDRVDEEQNYVKN